MCRQWLNRKRIVIVQGADCCWWSHFAETSEKKISHDETFQKVEQVFLSWHLKYWEKLRCFLKGEIKVKGKPTGLGQGKQFTQLSFHFSKKAETSLLLISPTHRVGAVEHWLKKKLMFLLLSDVVSMALPAKEYLPQKGRRWQQFNLHWNFWPLFEMFLYSASFVFVISLLPYPSTLTELLTPKVWRSFQACFPWYRVFYSQSVTVMSILIFWVVHMVPWCLHSGEVCGQQESSGIARLSGWSEERTRASSGVSCLGPLLIHCKLGSSCHNMRRSWGVNSSLKPAGRQ